MKLQPLSDQNLTEEDVKFRHITPSIESKGWSKENIRMELQVTDGRIKLDGNKTHRESAKKADYVLFYNRANPIAIVEAKSGKRSASYGLQQAKEYGQMMDVPFVYSSNGKRFFEYDFLTGKERDFPMDQFPSYEELWARYQREANDGDGLSVDEINVIDKPFCTGQDIFEPRYYQRNAVNRTLSAITRGQNRVLLVMATGTGKTYTAFQIIWRLRKAGLKKKVLYLADRNILVDQSMQQDFRPLENVFHKVQVSSDDPMKITSYDIHFALYQQLKGSNDADHYKELYRPDFFDLIIVDECHRGSANENSEWRSILDYFNGATQIGLTATPKETEDVSNSHYFGDPVYSYSLNDGINDGFLAPFKVLRYQTNIGNGWRPIKGQTDILGNEIEDREYNSMDYDYNIVLQDRIREVAEAITAHLKATDTMSKTIVFCADEDHAERMRSALVNANSEACRKNPDYVVRITGSDDYGKGKLQQFISVSQSHPVIATTSELLSTGVDCKMVKLIVLDQNIKSMTKFKQIIGRGTRLREDDNKTHFEVLDFRNVTQLFADPDWDGPIEVDPNYTPNKPPKESGYKGSRYDEQDDSDKVDSTVPSGPVGKPIVSHDGCNVFVISKEIMLYDTDGKLLRRESIIDYTKRNMLGNYATLDSFKKGWSTLSKKTEMRDMLLDYGIDIDLFKKEMNMLEVDDFDFLCHIAYGQKPLTRRERAANVKKQDVFNKYGEDARKVLDGLLEKYKNDGIVEMEDLNILRTDPFNKIGSPSYIAEMFGGKDGYLHAVTELESMLYQTA